jgi:hypothetical protein
MSNPSDERSATRPQSFEHAWQLGYKMCLLVEVKASVHRERQWLQPLAAVLEALQAQAAAQPHAAGPHVMWALLTDTTLWCFFRVELHNGTFYVSRSGQIYGSLRPSDLMANSQGDFLQVRQPRPLACYTRIAHLPLLPLKCLFFHSSA